MSFWGKRPLFRGELLVLGRKLLYSIRSKFFSYYLLQEWFRFDQLCYRFTYGNHNHNVPIMDDLRFSNPKKTTEKKDWRMGISTWDVWSFHGFAGDFHIRRYIDHLHHLQVASLQMKCRVFQGFLAGSRLTTNTPRVTTEGWLSQVRTGLFLLNSSLFALEFWFKKKVWMKMSLLGGKGLSWWGGAVFQQKSIQNILIKLIKTPVNMDPHDPQAPRVFLDTSWQCRQWPSLKGSRPRTKYLPQIQWNEPVSFSWKSVDFELSIWITHTGLEIHKDLVTFYFWKIWSWKSKINLSILIINMRVSKLPQLPNWHESNGLI